jgi:hypothetical protein
VRERDWDNLIWNVRRARSVLFTGPDLDAGASGPTAALTARLGDLLRDERRPVQGHGLPAVAQQLEDDPQFGRSDLEREVARFHEATGAPGADGVEARIASLPFPLVITTDHGPRLGAALGVSGKRVEIGRYHFRGANPPVTFANDPAAPLVYHLHGVASEPPSLVLTERDVLEMLERVLAQRPGLPDALSAHLQKRDTTFLFLGAGLREQYLRMLLHALKINRDDRSLAVEEAEQGPADADHEDTVLFYERGKITLYDTPIAAFVDDLRRRFEASGGAVAAAPTGPAVARPRVFISYASEDAARAKRLFDALEQAGFDTWLDKARLEGGDRWDATIEGEIGRSDYVLVLQSRAQRAKIDSYVNTEIGLALKRAAHVRAPFKCLVPLQIELGEMLDDLAADQTEPLGVSPEGYDADLKKLVSLLRRDYQLRQRERVS